MIISVEMSYEHVQQRNLVDKIFLPTQNTKKAEKNDIYSLSEWQLIIRKGTK